MAHGRYSYWPISDRPALRWPNCARVALVVVPNIEHFPWEHPRSAGRAGPFPDVPSFTLRDYGNRVGVWRLAETLAKYGVRATVALNSDICRHEPQIITLGAELGWEWMGHGRTNAERLAGLDEEAERALIRDVLRTIEDATGAPPNGWFSPGLAHTEHTPDLVAEAGCTYIADWFADDQPVPMRVQTGRLIGMPGSQVSDAYAYGHAQWPAHEFTTLLRKSFDQLYQEGERSGRMMCIALHPYLSGHPGRICALDEALQYITGHEHVWRATGAEIANWYYEHYYEDAVRLAPFPDRGEL